MTVPLSSIAFDMRLQILQMYIFYRVDAHYDYLERKATMLPLSFSDWWDGLETLKLKF